MKKMQQSTTTVLGVRGMALALKYLLQLGYYLGLIYCIYLMGWITLQYLPPRWDAAFLNIKQQALSHPYYIYAFYVHVWVSLPVLILGIPQFSKSFRARFTIAHQRLGKAYISLILILAAPSGLIMGIHANGGWTAQCSFVLQAGLWWWWTWTAYQKARQQDWKKHEYYMLLSYALTLSAISLRIWKWSIVLLWAPPPMDTYRLVAWLGWLGNVLIVQGYWWTQQSKKIISSS